MKLILDAFCNAGGSAMGLYRGFIDRYPDLLIVGVDRILQKNYPAFHNKEYSKHFAFVQADALELPFDLSVFDFIWASPPCQGYSTLQYVTGKEYDLLIAPVRKMLLANKKPFIIENVKGGRYELDNPLMLCGTMFGLRVQRHRYFECNPPIMLSPYSCNHWGKTSSTNGAKRAKSRASGTPIRGQRQSFKHAPFITVTGNDFNLKDASTAMGIDWMTSAELAESIPPAYSEFLARQFTI